MNRIYHFHINEQDASRHRVLKQYLSAKSIMFPNDYASSGFKSHSSSSNDELSIESTDFDPYIKLLPVWGCWSPEGWHCNLLQWPPSNGSMGHYHITSGCLLSLLSTHGSRPESYLILIFSLLC